MGYWAKKSGDDLKLKTKKPVTRANLKSTKKRTKGSGDRKLAGVRVTMKQGLTWGNKNTRERGPSKQKKHGRLGPGKDGKTTCQGLADLGGVAISEKGRHRKKDHVPPGGVHKGQLEPLRRPREGKTTKGKEGN